jgi:hypothetical protein
MARRRRRCLLHAARLTGGDSGRRLAGVAMTRQNYLGAEEEVELPAEAASQLVEDLEKAGALE